VIEVENVSKEYGRFTAVSELSFSVGKGEILGFLGPNGAGKTTTMRILTGFLPPTRGTARVVGHDVSEEPLAVKSKIGYLPESPPLYPEMTVWDYLDFVARIKMSPALSRTRAKRVDEVLERCAIREVQNKLCGKLSKGYRQRVGLAQALVHEPEVLILDEPTAGLDPKQINETRELIKTFGGDHTVILSTHILPEVSMTCERVVIINGGRLVAEGTPQGLTERFTGGGEILVTAAGEEATLKRALTSVAGVADVRTTPASAPSAPPGAVLCRVEIEPSASESDTRSSLAAAVVKAGLGLLELRSAASTLEEVYLRAISEEATASIESSRPEHGMGDELGQAPSSTSVGEDGLDSEQRDDRREDVPS
jgi:ABC-2 type transport system ATP-binding protein